MANRGSREARVLAAVLRAAGLSSLVVAGACADRPLAGTEGSASITDGDTDTTTSGVATETTETTASTETTETTATTTEPTSTDPTATSGPTSETTVDTTRPTTDDFPDCPFEYFETDECGDPGETTGDDSGTTDDGLSTTGDETTGTTGTTGDETTGTTGDDSTGTGTTGGLCDGWKPNVFDDCGKTVVGFSEPFEQRGQCCVTVTWEAGCCGRPFLVEETARTATAVRRGDWRSPVAPALAGLSAAERRALAAEWCEDGLVEHASVAAFARFVLQLMALGAPAELVAAAQQAMADETVHARLCFGLAAAYGGAEVGPSALPLAGALAGADDLITVTVAALREGCIGETIAAMQAEAALDRARDPAVRAALARIAADELRHAELAWRFVAWALEQGGPELHAACAEALAAAEARALAPAIGLVGHGEEDMSEETSSERADGGRDEDTLGHGETDMSEGLRAHGRLGAAGRAAVARRAWTAVIGPAARALLERRAPAAA